MLLFLSRVNRCVGLANHRSFFLVIFAMILAASIHAYFCFLYVFGYAPAMGWSAWQSKVTWFLLVHSLLIVLCCGALLVGQSYTVSMALTTNEAMNRWRYAYISNNHGQSPFDEGRLRNCLTFWGVKQGKSFVRTNGAAGARPGFTFINGGGGSGQANPSDVVLQMDGHGHSHGGQACHGHGGGGGQSDSEATGLASPPAPEGSLHFPSSLHPSHAQQQASFDLDPECAYFHGGDESQQQQLTSPASTTTYRAEGEHAHAHATGANETEATGLISGKDKHN